MKSKPTPQDMHSIAQFYKIVRNYLAMCKALEADKNEMLNPTKR